MHSRTSLTITFHSPVFLRVSYIVIYFLECNHLKYIKCLRTIEVNRRMLKVNAAQIVIFTLKTSALSDGRSF